MTASDRSTPRPRRTGPIAAACMAALLSIGLVACAGSGQSFARNAQALIDSGRVEDALPELERAAVSEPDNRHYRMELIRQREVALGRALTQGDRLLAAGHAAAALEHYQRAEQIMPGNPRARAGVDAAGAELRWSTHIDEARRHLEQGRPDEAARRVGEVLAENPAHAGARALRQQLQPPAATAAATPPTETPLQRQLRKRVSMDFREAPLRAVFDGLARDTGINFVFDREVRSDIRVSVSIANVTIEDAIGAICASHQLERKILNDNSLLIYPNVPAKLREHQELAVKTVFLSNVDAKSVVALLKAVLKTRDVYADEKLNTITVRDTPDAVRLAEKMALAQDQPEPEVLLDVEVLEIKRSRLTEIGVEPPGKFSVLNLVRNPATVVSTATGNTTIENNTLTTTQLTLDKLRGVTSASIGIDNPSVNLRAENGDTNILANPRIRVRNRDKARIHIGDRVPVITTTSTPNVGVSESVNYLDVGLKLEVEPNVFLDNEVGVRVNLEVSNLVREVKSRTGTLTYQIGTRLATTSLRLKDGETQALAGLISDEDRSGAVGVPGLVSLPLLGRLFSSERSDRSKTEIVLLITPRVVRNHDAIAVTRHEFGAGTEAAVGASPVRIQGTGRLSVAPVPTAAPRQSSGAAPAQPSAPELDAPSPPQPTQ